MSVLDVLASTHSNLFIVRHFYFIDFAQYGCNVTYINQVIIRQIIKIAFNPPPAILNPKKSSQRPLQGEGAVVQIYVPLPFPSTTSLANLAACQEVIWQSLKVSPKVFISFYDMKT